MKPRDAERSKNFFALGLISWLYTRPVEPTLQWIEDRFENRELVLAANLAAFKAGYHFGDTAELFEHPYSIAPARLAPGTYRNDHRQPRARVRPRRRGPAEQAADSLRVVPDHARVRHPPRAVEAQELRCAHAAGRGRDRSDRCRDRRRVRRAARCHRHERSRRRPEVGGDGSRDQPRAAAHHRRRAARRPVHRVCRRRPSRPTCCSRCTAVTAKRRCRSSPRTRRATASTPPSKRPGSR